MSVYEKYTNTNYTSKDFFTNIIIKETCLHKCTKGCPIFNECFNSNISREEANKILINLFIQKYEEEALQELFDVLL